jgi:hypothetical protein
LRGNTLTIDTSLLHALASAEPTFDAEAKELSARVQLGPRNVDFLVFLELFARHDRERQLFEGILRWRVTNSRGEGDFHSSSHAKDVVLVELPNPRYSGPRLREVFDQAVTNLRDLSTSQPGLFAEILNPAHDEWARQSVRAPAA